MTNDKMKIKEIKTTSELGCMLDTERPWTELPREINTPNDSRNVEVILKDGTTTVGWCGSINKNWYVSNGEKNEIVWPLEDKNNPVVAWRELVTEK